MPSSHSATVMSLAAAIGLKDGCGGSTFALAIVVACVVSPILNRKNRYIPWAFVFYTKCVWIFVPQKTLVNPWKEQLYICAVWGIIWSIHLLLRCHLSKSVVNPSPFPRIWVLINKVGNITKTQGIWVTKKKAGIIQSFSTYFQCMFCLHN